MPVRSKKQSPLEGHRHSMMRRVADAIRRDALGCSEGQLLGSEDDLIVRYGVSRPTLRQAAALISQENLLVVKRGVGGGYFVRRPNSKAVAHVAAVYLRTRMATVEDIVRAFAPLRIEVAKLAARGNDAEARQRLKQFLSAELSRAHVTLGEFVRAERELGRLMADLSGNKVISLFLEILYDCSALLSPDEDIFRNHPDRVDIYRDKRNKLVAAVVDGDQEIAVLAAGRLASTTAEWMMQDLQRREPLERLIAVPGLLNTAPPAFDRSPIATEPAAEGRAQSPANRSSARIEQGRADIAPVQLGAKTSLAKRRATHK